MGPESSLHRWHGHSETVLDIRTNSAESVIQSAEQRPVREELAQPPVVDGVMEALDKLKGNKAGGKTGILPEMLKCCGAVMMEYILDLFGIVWKEERFPAKWRDALLVPIPKIGDLTICGNWHGISLLDVMGELFVKVIQGRLQVVVEDTLPDSQCGFRCGRGCIDMIFCARQIMEKAREHDTKVFVLFVDLKKAYDSVPCQALWMVLEKYGIPPLLVRLIQSLHDGMKVDMSIDVTTTPVIEVNNGLRQSCTITPSVFNLYFNLVIKEWRKRCQPFGTEVLYKCGGKLVGERTKRPSHVLVTELKFADDAAVVGDSRESIVRAAERLVEVLSEWGLT